MAIAVARLALIVAIFGVGARAYSAPCPELEGRYRCETVNVFESPDFKPALRGLRIASRIEAGVWRYEVFSVAAEGGESLEQSFVASGTAQPLTEDFTDSDGNRYHVSSYTATCLDTHDPRWTAEPHLQGPRLAVLYPLEKTLRSGKMHRRESILVHYMPWRGALLIRADMRFPDPYTDIKYERCIRGR